jgi:hypothetical protein
MDHMSVNWEEVLHAQRLRISDYFHSCFHNFSYQSSSTFKHSCAFWSNHKFSLPSGITLSQSSLPGVVTLYLIEYIMNFHFTRRRRKKLQVCTKKFAYMQVSFWFFPTTFLFFLLVLNMTCFDEFWLVFSYWERSCFATNSFYADMVNTNLFIV